MSTLETPHHPSASWIWLHHDPSQGRATRFLRFRLSFQTRPEESRLHLLLSADQRFQLHLDGRRLLHGPDRSDLAHWSLHEVEQDLAPGPHLLEVLVMYIAEDPAALNAGMAEHCVSPPMAQVSWRAGFYLEGLAWAERLSTGRADWKAVDLSSALSLHRKTGLGYHDIGPEYRIDLAGWHAEGPLLDTAVVLGPASNLLDTYGIQRPGWRLCRTPLPPQQLDRFEGGVLRQGEGVRELAPHQHLTLLWDFGTYLCGYPDLAWSGGKGSEISVEWAESLYEHQPGRPLSVDTPKGNRSEVNGKVWLGFGDRFVASGARESSPGLWWRAGRYLRIELRTREAPLTLDRIAILRTGYPLHAADHWRSSDPEWDALLPLFRTTIEAGAHETWADSPYYEQMMYVGDTRLHALSNYLCYPDDRLSRRAIDLLRYSRSGSPDGLVAERYPSAWRQNSTTYALIWVWMVRDYLYWRDDLSFVRTQLPAVRQLIESVLALRREDGLLGAVPGWPFVDWVPAWHQGCGPGVREGDSSLVNLHWVLALQAAAQIEEAVGEALLAERCRTLASHTMTVLLARYWSTPRACLLDSQSSDQTSEHAQILALLTGLAGAERDRELLQALETEALDARCTIYFRFYLLEALARHGRAELFFRRLDAWRALPALGFVSTPEQPEPTRSDCHAWSAHPLFHTYASIAGIRSESPGFRKVRVRPLPGPLHAFEAEVSHPAGCIRVRYDAGRLDVEVPEGVELLR